MRSMSSFLAVSMITGTALRVRRRRQIQKAVLSGQHEVENHEVWFHPGKRAVDAYAVLGDLDGKAFTHEKVGEQRADVAVVLDEKNGLAGHVGNLDAQKTQAMPNRRTVTNRYKSTAR